MTLKTRLLENIECDEVAVTIADNGMVIASDIVTP